ncbi:similar to ENHANCED DISEASE RESISTANCE protein [Actinidia rufa]|uniref:Similar to ENHANCED DISEASE RESISTANCE protein n=1 Tax=Actinidia rufa TaxID=165716 RepID=A0A7J0DSW6_9ERIC|nr:similar to ENHANCED DISEASE RESISTANCE protein [Actinidia rufa]
MLRETLAKNVEGCRSSKISSKVRRDLEQPDRSYSRVDKIQREQVGVCPDYLRPWGVNLKSAITYKTLSKPGKGGQTLGMSNRSCVTLARVGEVGRCPDDLRQWSLEVPAKPNYSLVLYYAADRPINKNSLLGKFVDGSDMFRDSRFKLIPRIVEGYWMVKRAVGTKACLLGKAVTCKYLRQDNFLEIDVDIGSSSVARSVISLVLGYVTSIVIDLAILIERRAALSLSLSPRSQRLPSPGISKEPRAPSPRISKVSRAPQSPMSQ